MITPKTVKELIEELSKYNQEARVGVVVHCRSEEFSIAFGGAEGVTPETCDSVSLYVDRLCRDETLSSENGG